MEEPSGALDAPGRFPGAASPSAATTTEGVGGGDRSDRSGEVFRSLRLVSGESLSPRGGVRGDPREALKDIAHLPGAAAPEHADGVDDRLRRDAVESPGDDGGDVRPVPVAVDAAVAERVSVFFVGGEVDAVAHDAGAANSRWDADARVEDVDVRAGAARAGEATPSGGGGAGRGGRGPRHSGAAEGHEGGRALGQA